MVLVPTNMPCFGFSSCNFFSVVLVPAKYFVFENILFLKRVPMTLFKNKIFCRDLFKNQNILQGLFFYKVGSVIMCCVCKSSQKWGQGLKPRRDTYLQGPKTTKKNKYCRD